MSRAKENADSAAVRERILTAAFEAFQERGYAATSTLEIKTGIERSDLRTERLRRALRASSRCTIARTE